MCTSRSWGKADNGCDSTPIARGGPLKRWALATLMPIELLGTAARWASGCCKWLLQVARVDVLPLEHGHSWIGDATNADAILHRLLQRAHRFKLEGHSRRTSTPQAAARKPTPASAATAA